MTQNDNHFVALGAKQRNKLATYGKGLRNGPPTLDLFCPSVTLDDDEDFPHMAKRSATSKPKTHGAVAKKRLIGKDVNHLLPVKAAKLEAKSLFDVPSSDSEHDAYSRSRAGSKKRKLEHQVISTIQDGVYDDESLQRHIAAEAQRDQENLRFFAQSKTASTSTSVDQRTTVRQDDVGTGAQKPKAKASLASKSIKTVTAPAKSSVTKAPKKLQTLSSNSKSQTTTLRYQPSSSLANDPEALPLSRALIVRSASLARKTSATRAQTSAIEDVAALSHGPLPTGAVQSKQSKSSSATQGKAKPQRREGVSESPSRTPPSTVKSLMEFTSLTPKAKPLHYADKNNQSPSTLVIQNMQLSSPPETPSTVRKAKSSTAIRTLAEHFKPRLGETQPRKRIIDRLYRHSSCSSAESDEEKEEDKTANVDSASTRSSAPSPSQPLSISRVDEKLGLDEAALEDEPNTQQTTRSSQSTYGNAKVTYQHQRSYLTEEMVDEADIFKIPILPDPVFTKSSRRSKAVGKVPGLPGLPSLQPSFEIDEDVDDMTTGPTRNIHELRQAGGNARLLGSMEAILDDIDPKKHVSLSTRRNGLLDLHRSLMQPVSCQAFIDHGLVDQLVAQFDVSIDEITGILVLSCFASVLGQKCPEHLLTLINDAQVFAFLGTRLQSTEEFKVTVGKRISNLSRVMQQELVQFAESLLASSMWAGETPSCLTAQTLSLHCLEAAVRHLREAGCAVDALSQQLVSTLVDIAVSAVNALKMSPDLASDVSFAEFRQAISILEYTTTISPSSDMHDIAWLTDSIEQTSQLLPMLCNQSSDQWAKAQLLVLRLCLNLTNGSGSTCEIFSRTEVVHAVVSMVLSGFRGLDDEDDDDLYAVVLDKVVLALGLLINLAESSDAARLQFLKRGQGNKTSLDALLQLFNSNFARASEVVSERDTKSNVAFGYLSVLLAHLSLNKSIRQRVKLHMQGAHLQPLLTAVGEFLEYNRRVTDQIIHEGEQEVDLKAGFLGRLQELLEQLHAA